MVVSLSIGYERISWTCIHHNTHTHWASKFRKRRRCSCTQPCSHKPNYDAIREFGIHPTNHRMHHANAFLTITKRMSFHSINLISAISYLYPCRAKASENPPKPDSSLCPGALLEMWFATWSRKHSLKTQDFLPISIDRCIVIYLDLCKTCAQQTQFIGSYVFGWSFRLSMPRLGKSWNSHIRWPKK